MLKIAKRKKTQKVHKKAWDQFCVGQPVLGIGPALECGRITQLLSTGENDFSLSHWLSITNSGRTWEELGEIKEYDQNILYGNFLSKKEY